MRRIGYRHQRTLARPSEILGVGFITGAPSRLIFRPAVPDTGLVFLRTDRPSKPIAVHPSRVTGTARRTTLGPSDSGVTLVEHVLAALAGLRIDNCIIELNAPEPPGLDGSALGFVEALSSAGVELQSARRALWAVDEPVVLSEKGATIGLHPPTSFTDFDLRVSYLLDYGPVAPIPRQAFTLAVSPESFQREIAGCRTFLLEPEAEALRKDGIGSHLTPKDLLVFGNQGPIENRLRRADEPARHKVLDLMGDLALCGFDVVGHLVAYRSGHALNVALAKALVARTATSERVIAPPRRSRTRQRAAA